MPCDVARRLASAGRMTDVDRVAKVESLSHGRGILCVVIHVVAPIHLCGASVATPIVRNDTISMRMEEEHLCIPRSEEHTSELQSLMRISYAVFCLKTKKKQSMTQTHLLLNQYKP